MRAIGATPRDASGRRERVMERFVRALRDRRGIAAVEFALLLPLMLLMYIGTSDITRGVIVSRDVDLLSRTISDLVAQKPISPPVPSSQIQTIFAAASAVMVPFDTSSLTLTVSAVDITQNSNNTCCQVLVRWSYAQGSTTTPPAPRVCGALTQVAAGTAPSATNIPSAIVNANTSAGYSYTGANGQNSYLIIADVTYTYTPYFSQAVSWFLPGMRKTTFMVPRSLASPITLASPLSFGTGPNNQAQSGQICSLTASQ